MTTFEIIILVLIYCFCYGYAAKILEVNDESLADIICRTLASFLIAFYVPIIIGTDFANKLNN